MEPREGRKVSPPDSLDEYRRRKIAEGTLHRAMVPRYSRESRWNEFDHRLVVPIAASAAIFGGPILFVVLSRLAPSLFNALP